MWAPHKVILRFVGRLVYWYAEKRYGVEARGDVRGFKIISHPVFGSYGVSDFTEKQEKMNAKWHYWMDVKNKILW